jgi:hypothetical protein
MSAVGHSRRLGHVGDMSGLPQTADISDAVGTSHLCQTQTLAIGRLVMSTRERICAIEIEEGGLVLTTLRTAEEVRSLDEVGSPDLPKPDPWMLQIAEKIVEKQSGDFDPDEFHDRYEDALKALIEQKRKRCSSGCRFPHDFVVEAPHISAGFLYA